jgi:NAD(P)-dependent dehydrogenase (short-subunit alcohol dehydrogenase family)
MSSTVLQRLFAIEGKIAVVTDSGGNSGVDVARVLARAGAKIVVADKEAAHLRAIVAEIVAAGGAATAIETNVESEASVVSLFEQVRAQLGTPGFLLT